MTERERDDLYYVCSLIEYICRKTQNFPTDVVQKIGRQGLEWLLNNAEINHCLSFEQVSDEVIESCNISSGNRNMNYKYELPRFLAIGREYATLIEDVAEEDKTIIHMMYEVFTSFISTEISNYNSALYYSGRSYIAECYRQKKVLK